MKIENCDQLDLGLHPTAPDAASGPPHSAFFIPHSAFKQRSRWWFDRMRQLVDTAIDWSPTPPPRPEQTWLPNSIGPNSPEHQFTA
jgi:hypothetical protein